MFMTEDEMELTLPIELKVEGRHMWNSVNYTSQISWYHLVFEPTKRTDKENGQVNYLIPGHILLDKFIREIEGRIIELAIMTPPSCNSHDYWKMEQVNEIWFGSVKYKEFDSISSGQYIVFTDAGKRYAGSFDSQVVMHEEVSYDLCIYSKKKIKHLKKTSRNNLLLIDEIT